MQDYGLLDIIEQIQRTQDPLVTKAQQERENKSPFRPGGLTSIKISLPETDSSLPAPTSTLRSDYGTGYSRTKLFPGSIHARFFCFERNDHQLALDDVLDTEDPLTEFSLLPFPTLPRFAFFCFANN